MPLQEQSSRVIEGDSMKKGGFKVSTNLYIGGVPAAEWERLQAMNKRLLQKSDIPNEPWRSGMDTYFLREDGAILVEGIPVEIGFVKPDGTVAWVQC